jgi:hypothetical protein
LNQPKDMGLIIWKRSRRFLGIDFYHFPLLCP